MFGDSCGYQGPLSHKREVERILIREVWKLVHADAYCVGLVQNNDTVTETIPKQDFHKILVGWLLVF